jgi:drug/metabolite transporter (DMT)-like permease
MADTSLLISAVLWGINIPVVKFATLHVDALTFNAIRMVLSTITLGLCCAVEQKMLAGETLGQVGKERMPLETVAPGRPLSMAIVVLFCLLSGLLYPLAFMHGIHRTTAANTALLLASMPMWTALLSSAFLGEKIKAGAWLGMAITFAGVAIVIQAKSELSFFGPNLRGNLLMILAANLWAAATVVSTPLLRRWTPLQLASLSALLTTPIHLAMNLDGVLEWCIRGARGPLILAVLYSGILSTGLAYATWHYGVGKLGGSHASVYQNIVTLVAVLAGWLALGEPVLGLQVLGGGLVIAGLIFLRRRR